MKPLEWVQPTVLMGHGLILEPLTIAHAEQLYSTVEPETFRYWVTLVPRDSSVEAFRDFLQRMIDLPNAMNFAVYDAESKQYVGKTSLMDIRPEALGVEIGMTWIDPKRRGTWVNAVQKYLLLEHCFNTLKAIRVQLKTDARNEASRRAILSIGASFEGILRRHGIQIDGNVRDTAMYSITDQDWESVRERLLAKIAAKQGSETCGSNSN